MKVLIFAILLAITGLTSAAIKVETFNVGLARGFVDHAQERLPEILKALRGSDADVLCLQEVWDLSDRQILANVLSKKFKNVYHTPVYQTTTAARPSCRPWDLFGEGKFVSCMNSQCKGAEGDDFTDCIIAKCGASLERLKQDNRECASALMAKVGKNPIVSMLQLMNPFYRAGLFAYRGSNGLMLASKLPLKNKKLLDFSDISTLNRRQALSASIYAPGGEIQVVCTHLSSFLPLPYTGTSEGWAKENFKQAARLVDTTDTASRSLLLGDFNCGLEDQSGGLKEELPETCHLLNKYFSDPASEIGECSFCAGNTLTAPGTKDVIIDHIYTRDLSVTDVKIVHKNLVEIETASGKKALNLSDHYGVSITID